MRSGSGRRPRGKETPGEDPVGDPLEGPRRRGEDRIVRVALDTNIFVAAGFRPESDSAAVLLAVRSGALRLAWSEATRRETESLLDRIPPLSREAVRDVFREEDRVEVRLDTERFQSVPDPDDRKFAALASAAGAVLITLDRPLLDAAADGGFLARTPSGLLREWSDSPVARDPADSGDG